MRSLTCSSIPIALSAFLAGCQMPNPAFENDGESGETRGQDTLAGDGDGDTGDGDGEPGDGDGEPGDGDGDGDGDTNTGDGDGDGDTNTGDGDGDGDTNTGDGDGDPNACNPGQMMCDGQCIEPDFDNENCGDCGNICVDNQQCAFGMCKPRKLVFVTEAKFPGNFGGVDVGNGICNEVAADAELPVGDYRAWLSDNEKAPANTFETEGVYVLPKGEVVAWSWEDLRDGTILHPINQIPNGQLMPESPACNELARGVWTGTAPNGMPLLPNCNQWMSNSQGVQGRLGNADANDVNWSDGECSAACNNHFPIYCVQQ